MIEIATALAWSGIYGVFGLAAIGSILGCAIAGQAAIGAMLETDGATASSSGYPPCNRRRSSKASS